METLPWFISALKKKYIKNILMHILQWGWNRLYFIIIYVYRREIVIAKCRRFAKKNNFFMKDCETVSLIWQFGKMIFFLSIRSMQHLIVLVKITKIQGFAKFKCTDNLRSHVEEAWTFLTPL